MNNEKKIKEIYPYNNVWIDWGALSQIFELRSNDPSKYDYELAKERLEILLSVLSTTEKIENPRLFFGFQCLESGSEERRAFLKKLSEENNQVYLSLPEKSGFEAIHWLYVLMEIQALFICFHEGFPNEYDVRLKFMQDIAATKGINERFDSLKDIDFKKNKILGKNFKDIVDNYKDIYKKLDISKIYILEKKAMMSFAEKITIEQLPKITKFLFGKESDDKITTVMNQFIASNYFKDIHSIEIFLNLFVTLMSNKREYEISESERQDLLGIVEISLFCNVGYVDKRIKQTWDGRFNKSISLNLLPCGKVITEVFKEVKKN